MSSESENSDIEFEFPPLPPCIFTQEDAERFNLAQSLLEVVVSRYSAIIGKTTDPAEKMRLLKEQTYYYEKAHTLRITDREAIEKAIDEAERYLEQHKPNK